MINYESDDIHYIELLQLDGTQPHYVYIYIYTRVGHAGCRVIFAQHETKYKRLMDHKQLSFLCDFNDILCIRWWYLYSLYIHLYISTFIWSC